MREVQVLIRLHEAVHAVAFPLDDDFYSPMDKPVHGGTAHQGIVKYRLPFREVAVTGNDRCQTALVAAVGLSRADGAYQFIGVAVHGLHAFHDRLVTDRLGKVGLSLMESFP